MTNAQHKAATEAVLDALSHHTDDPTSALIVLGAAISTIARNSRDPVRVARWMIDGIEGWIRLYEAEQKARSC